MRKLKTVKIITDQLLIYVLPVIEINKDYYNPELIDTIYVRIDRHIELLHGAVITFLAPRKLKGKKGWLSNIGLREKLITVYYETT